MSENPQSELSRPREAEPLPFVTLYHISPYARWPSIEKSGLLAQPDLTNVWGVFMIEPRNYLKYWIGEDSRLLRSIEGPPYALLRISVTPEMMRYIKIRSIPELRKAIRELVDEGVISGYFAAPLPKHIPYKEGRYEALNGLPYEDYAKAHPETPDFKEAVEIINYDKIPPKQIQFVASFTNVSELRAIIMQEQAKNSSQT